MDREGLGPATLPPSPLSIPVLFLLPAPNPFVHPAVSPLISGSFSSFRCYPLRGTGTPYPLLWLTPCHAMGLCFQFS